MLPMNRLITVGSRNSIYIFRSLISTVDKFTILIALHIAEIKLVQIVF